MKNAKIWFVILVAILSACVNKGGSLASKTSNTTVNPTTRNETINNSSVAQTEKISP